jgi:hypothetical protein
MTYYVQSGYINPKPYQIRVAGMASLLIYTITHLSCLHAVLILLRTYYCFIYQLWSVADCATK